MIAQLDRLIRACSPRRARTHHVLLAASILLQALATLLLVPLLEALLAADARRTLLWLGALALSVIAGWILELRRDTLALEIGFDLLDAVQPRIAARVGRIPGAWLTPRRRERLTHVLSGTGPDLVGSVGYLFAPTVTGFALPVLLAVGLGAVGLAHGPIPALVLAGTAALAYLGVLLAWWGTVRLQRRADLAAETANREVTARLAEFAGAQRTLRAARRARSETAQVRRAVGTDARATMRLVLLQAPEQILFSLATNLALLGLALAAVLLFTGGLLPGATAVGVVVVAVRLIEPLASLADLAVGSARSRLVLEEVQEALDAPQLPEAEPVTEPAGVRLEDVALGYAGSPDVVSGLSLDLAPGSATAIIGPSGSGKTTLLHAMAGLAQPRAGTVRIGEREALPGMTAVVLQVPWLFDRTLVENIGVSRPDDAVPEEVLRRARIPEIAAAQADGWETRVGEGGKRLSGGERQRVSIARALSSPSSVLLIDEATSALDHEMEVAIREAVAAGGRTRVIVAHRPQAVAGVDRVVVMEAGRIVADGRPEDLAGTCAYYDAFLAEGAAAEGEVLIGEG